MGMQRNHVIVITIIVIALASAIVSLYITERETVRQRGAERVAVVPLSGPIAERASGLAMASSITPERVRKVLSTIKEDPSIRAVVLRIDSPGGSVAASQAISSMIAEFPLPVVVSMGDMAASGGYYIASASDGIVAHPGTITGSIGVILTAMNLEGLYEKLGIEMEIIKSGRHKDMMQRTLTDAERRLLQDLSDEAYEQFIGHIAHHRNMDPEDVRALATGEVFLGSQAYELGLVDVLGGEEEAILLAGELAELRDPQRHELPPPSPFQWMQWLTVEARILLQNRFVPEPMRWIEMFEQYNYPRVNY